MSPRWGLGNWLTDVLYTYRPSGANKDVIRNAQEEMERRSAFPTKSRESPRGSPMNREQA